jgi:hypothetical protein
LLFGLALSAFGLRGLKFLAIIMQYLYCISNKGTKAYL